MRSDAPRGTSSLGAALRGGSVVIKMVGGLFEQLLDAQVSGWVASVLWIRCSSMNKGLPVIPAELKLKSFGSILPFALTSSASLSFSVISECCKDPYHKVG